MGNHDPYLFQIWKITTHLGGTALSLAIGCVSGYFSMIAIMIILVQLILNLTFVVLIALFDSVLISNCRTVMVTLKLNYIYFALMIQQCLKRFCIQQILWFIDSLFYRFCILQILEVPGSKNSVFSNSVFQRLQFCGFQFSNSRS